MHAVAVFCQQIRWDEECLTSCAPFLSFPSAVLEGTRRNAKCLTSACPLLPKIALKELREKKIPFTIRRYLPDGRCVWGAGGGGVEGKRPQITIGRYSHMAGLAGAECGVGCRCGDGDGSRHVACTLSYRPLPLFVALLRPGLLLLCLPARVVTRTGRRMS